MVPSVHPRACGEHIKDAVRGCDPDGPSPRMRGTRRQDHRVPGQGRSIPAHAGNTLGLYGLTVSFTVHPRACGEHVLSHYADATPFGPSPRMRGTRRHGPPAGSNRRSIPAHAGNTHLTAHSANRRPVHPRACGEHFGLFLAFVAWAGPSPRMRGTLLGCFLLSLGGRSIPAHAGNTLPPASDPAPGSVHPRACGEHTFSVWRVASGRGPSPRMRGTRRASLWILFPRRSIPAHAGNTLPGMSRIH